MKTASKIKHPLRRNGTSQLERLMNSLIPENLRIDDHSLQDIIAATHSYAKCLQYYNENNQIDGDWACFWEVEPLTFLAIVSSIDTDGIITDYQLKKNHFDLLPEEEQNEAAEAQHALDLIEYIKEQAKKVEHFFRLLPAGLPLKSEILTLIRRDSQTDTEQLAGALHTLIGYHKEAYPRTLAEPEDLNHSQYAFFFSDHWEVKDPPAFYQIPFSTEYLARGYEKLDDLLKVFHKALVKIKKRAAYWFDRNIEQPQVREPHVALFLAFLRLFEYAREDLNGLTREHLEYYYKRVLHTREAPAVPDEVHLIFELANNVDQYLVEKGTELLAGKDKNNRPLIFRTLEDWVVSKAKVEELKNSFVSLERGKFHANPDVAKKYCEQEVLPNEKATTWRAMGDDKELPYGELGFAIASPQLILQEGNRRLAVDLAFRSGIPYLSEEPLRVSVSSEEEWLPLARALASGESAGEGTEGSSYKLIYDELSLKIGPMELARRLAADLVSDAGVYLGEQASANPEVAEMYDRTHGEIELLNHYVLQTAYNAIHALNQIIESGSETGEPYFLRAYFYWSLAKTFAPPLDLRAATNGDSNEEARTTLLKYTVADDLADRRTFQLGELYDQIRTDLESAKSKLSERSDSTRINRHAASAFLVRLYLELNNINGVLSECEEIINSGLYSFGEEPGEVFSYPDGNGPAAIWSYEIREKDLNDITAIFNWTNQAGEVSNRRSVPMSDAFLETIGWLNEDGAVSERAQNDKRYQQLFQTVAPEEDPLFSFDTLHVWCDKYHQNENPAGQTAVVIRYSEVILNYMYALLVIGDQDRSTEVFNNFLGFTYEDPSTEIVNSVQLSNIQRERAIEFILEGDRRNYLQALELNIPPGDRPESEPVDWLSESLYFTPLDYRDISFSSEAGITFRQMNLEAELKQDFPSVVGFSEPDSPGKINSIWPVLKFELNQSVEIPSSTLIEWLNAELTHIDLDVRVSGIRENLVVHSDLGVFQGIQEFLPFGAAPKKGKLFRLGNAESMRKKLDSIEFKFEWIDPPGFSNYDNNYVTENGGDLNFSSPQLKVDFLKNASFVPQTSGSTGGVNQTDELSILPDQLERLQGGIATPDGVPLGGVIIAARSPDGNILTTAETTKDGSFSLDLPEDSALSVLEFTPSESIQSQDPVRYYFETINLLEEGPSSARVSIILRPFFEFNLVESNTLVNEYRINNAGLSRYGNELEFERYAPTLPQGFIQLEMVNNDFLHSAYPTALSIQSIALAAAEGDQNAVRSAATLPKPPYTPATNGISLGYHSNQPISVGPSNDGIDQFYHILPFKGYREIALKRKSDTAVSLMYPYPAHDRESPDFAAGNLFIGLADLQPGSNLSLLIQMREGSEAEPDWQAPAIRWSYLTKENQWAPFTAEQILKDTTFGLTRTGLVQLMIPSAIVNETTLFQGELYWLRVAAVEDLMAEPPKSARALPRVVDIRAQALSARFENRDNDLAHLADPLPAGRVTKLLQSRSQVKTIEQPFPSFKGRLPEKGNAFYRRVSERLRHKDRAVTIWDYERLLLQQFPKVYRAKCLSHTNLTSELAPGHVLVAVIPDLQQRQDELPVEPRFSRGDLREMAQYLRPKTNLFVACTIEDEVGNIEEQYLWVVNPIYEPVRLKFDVRFRPGVDVNFHTFVLDDDLKEFLAPWLKDRSADIRFNQPLHRSKVVQFIEERPYVDVVLNLDIEHCGAPLPSRQQEVIPTTSRSILTTHLEEGKDPGRTDHEIRTFTGGDPAPC